MNKLLFVILSFTAFVHAASAQNQRLLGCMDPGLRQQSIDMKKQFTEQGFEVVRDGMMSMDNRQPLPVILSLKKGTFYQIIFIGHTRSSEIKLELYDGNDKKIDEKKQEIRNDGHNYISFSFMPEKTDAYLFILHQKMKNRGLCAGFTILELKQ